MTDGSGIKKFFANHWEKIVLWAVLISLFYLLKPFFLLIFLTFLITYITKSAADWIAVRTKVNYRLVTVAVFVVFVGLLGAIGAWVGPRLIAETNHVLRQFAGDNREDTSQKIDQFVENTVMKIAGDKKGQAVIDSEQYTALLENVKTEVSRAIKTALPDVIQVLIRAVKFGWAILVALLLAIVFSFILVMDWRRIGDAMKQLETSRIRTFYLGAAPHLRAFAAVLGKAFRAQAIIAACNTILTAAGLWALGVPNIALLSTIVFLCGFIPILGTFLSAVPILLFGIQVGGLMLAFQLVILIAVVHAFEAYVLNPRITGKVLHVHPILVLVLLLVGERFFGIWGMVVGVPIGYYVIRILSKRDESLPPEPDPIPPA